jgi:hypothetical protein
MLEKAYVKIAMKRKQVYGWHKHGCAIVNDNPCCM